MIPTPRIGLGWSRNLRVLCRTVVFAVLAPLYAGCAGSPQPAGELSGESPAPAAQREAVPAEHPRLAVREAPVTFTIVSDSVSEDPEMEALVAPFRDQMGERIREVIGEAGGPFLKGWPEGSLGNFATDAILSAARKRYPDSVHMALANNGGLRVPIAAGPITVEKMFELMPFENLVSVLTLTGSQVEELAQVIAADGGEPISGWSFRIDTVAGERVARDVRVGGLPVDPETRYRLATSDYLAGGGGGFDFLPSALDRTDLALLVRDAFIEYIRERGTIEPRMEGRIAGEVRE
jgi:2',3'-cyclic-nucleotide 2'-phosphodiesterase (5'-nucleotidase family)